ncbi:MAG: hypothetical protein GWP91_22305 [Rhodobacterales bacterium]|nr:hypothetical protein [Rhodobacterales bacterium]
MRLLRADLNVRWVHPKVVAPWLGGQFQATKLEMFTTVWRWRNGLTLGA